MGNIERFYTPEEIINISVKRSSHEMMRGINVFRTALRRYGFDVEMPEESDAQWAYYRAVASVFADGYIQGKQDERLKYRGGKVK